MRGLIAHPHPSWSGVFTTVFPALALPEVTVGVEINPWSWALTLGSSSETGGLTLIAGVRCWPLGPLSFGKLLSSEALAAEGSKPCPYFMHDRSAIMIPNSNG